MKRNRKTEREMKGENKEIESKRKADKEKGKERRKKQKVNDRQREVKRNNEILKGNTEGQTKRERKGESQYNLKERESK